VIEAVQAVSNRCATKTGTLAVAGFAATTSIIVTTAADMSVAPPAEKQV
jgi:hypothetical protein